MQYCGYYYYMVVSSYPVITSESLVSKGNKSFVSLHLLFTQSEIIYLTVKLD